MSSRTTYIATGQPYYLRGSCPDCGSQCSTQAKRCKPCDVIRQGSDSAANKAAHTRRKRIAQRERMSGMSPEYFDELLSAQEWCCAICAAELTEASGHADHDHQTATPRGILCGSCNRALGIMGDDMDRLLAAVAYLEAYA